MSERILDMRAQLQGARQVERELQGLEAQTRRVEQAAGAQTGAERSLTATLEAKNEALTQSVKGAEKLFSVTDALAGVVGKAVGVVGLINLAWDVGTLIYEKAAGAQAELAGAVEQATDAVKAQRQAIDEVVGAAERLAAGGGLQLAELTPAERREARARDLERRENTQALARLLAEEEQLEARVSRARAAGAVSALAGEADRISNQVAVLANRQRELDLIDETTRAEARRREGLDRSAPDAPRASPTRQSDILAGLPETASEFARRISAIAGESEGLESIFGQGVLGQAREGISALTEIVGQGVLAGNAYAGTLYEQARALDEVRQAGAAGRQMALGYAEAQGKAAAAAALTAALRGESVVEAVNAVLEGVAVEATVQAAFEVAKGLAASANPLTAPAAATHFAAAKAFGVTAAIAGAGALASGGFGGGSAPSSPADVQAPGGTPRGDGAFGRDRDEPSSTTIVIPMDLRTRPLATNNQLARELVRNLNDYGGVPGRNKIQLRRVGR